MGIHVHDIKEWLQLLKDSRDELLRIYGDRAIKGIGLYNRLDRAIKRSKEL
tara:strand:- start:2357 stop:2509 length:153 start_codon:yes stop_codon:yes gene_type:complete